MPAERVKSKDSMVLKSQNSVSCSTFQQFFKSASCSRKKEKSLASKINKIGILRTTWSVYQRKKNTNVVVRTLRAETTLDNERRNRKLQLSVTPRTTGLACLTKQLRVMADASRLQLFEQDCSYWFIYLHSSSKQNEVHRSNGEGVEGREGEQKRRIAARRGDCGTVAISKARGIPNGFMQRQQEQRFLCRPSLGNFPENCH